MDLWGWLAVASGPAAFVGLVRGLIHQPRRFPRNRARPGNPEAPRGRDIIRWYGSILGGGHG
jgi:hypothetical protein